MNLGGTQTKKAETHLYKSLELYTQLGDERGQFRNYYTLASLFSDPQEGNYKKASGYNLKAIILAKKLENQSQTRKQL